MEANWLEEMNLRRELHISTADYEGLSPTKRVFFLSILQVESSELKKRMNKTMKGIKHGGSSSI